MEVQQPEGGVASPQRPGSQVESSGGVKEALLEISQ